MFGKICLCEKYFATHVLQVCFASYVYVKNILQNFAENKIHFSRSTICETKEEKRLRSVEKNAQKGTKRNTTSKQRSQTANSSAS